MTDRILLSQDRLLITKPGVDASGSPTDAQKIFDSDWSFGGAIIASGLVSFPRNLTPGYWEIDFPPQTYIPAVQLFAAIPPDGRLGGGSPEGCVSIAPYWDKNQFNTADFKYPIITTSKIRIPCIVSGDATTLAAYRLTPGTSGQLYQGYAYIVYAV